MLSRHLAAVMLIACFWTGAASADTTSAPFHVGQVWRVFHPSVARNWRGAQTEGLRTTIWYPVDPDIVESAIDIGAPGDPIFHGHPVIDRAPVSTRHAKYPLLLLSHGTGGSANDLDWLGAALAANGYVVAGLNHPGNNALEPLTRDGFLLWWERATDVSEVLDGILADPMLGARIDPDRVGAVGFSLGGYTVLELAGARTNLRGFEDFCRSPAADAICRPPEMDRLKGEEQKMGEVSPEMKASMARSGASYRDKRIKAVFAIAPALGEAFDSTSFADVNIPVFLTGGTNDVTAPVETNIHRIAGFMPNAKVVMVPGAVHYTFLDTCLPAVAARLANICVDPPGVDRDKVHAETVERAVDFFMGTLGASSVGMQTSHAGSRTVTRDSNRIVSPGSTCANCKPSSLSTARHSLPTLHILFWYSDNRRVCPPVKFHARDHGHRRAVDVVVHADPFMPEACDAYTGRRATLVGDLALNRVVCKVAIFVSIGGRKVFTNALCRSTDAGDIPNGALLFG